jgi:hypothetical protein
MKLACFLLVLLVCLIPTTVYGAGFGISPYKVDAQVDTGQSVDLVFTVSGFNGAIEVSSENLPIEINPKTVEVSDGSKINLKLSCGKNITPSLYSGKLVFLAKGGSSVQSGIKVPCNLTVKGSIATAPITKEVEQSTNPTMLIIWVGIILVLLAGIIYLSRRLRDV